MTTPRITAIGLSPCWQQIVLLNELHIGEVNRAEQVLWCASGKAVNVALAAKRLGADVQLISVAGDPTGAALQRDVDNVGINARWIETTTSTRVCTTLLDRGTRGTTEIVENAGSITSTELAEFTAVCREHLTTNEIVVCSGSLPRGVDSNLWRELLSLCPVRSILDVRGIELIAALECRPLLIKPNREELSLTASKSLSSDAELISTMRDLCVKGAQWVLVTNGSGSALLASAHDSWRLHPAPIEPFNPIGSGDCLAAGVAYALAEGHSMLDAVRFGMGAAAENATTLLPAAVSLEGTRRLAQQVRVERISKETPRD